MRIAVIANGEWNPEWGSEELAECDILIAADGGANHAAASGRLPDVLIGDLDSITPDNLEKCRQKGAIILEYPREKDETDLELALHYACQSLSEALAGDREIVLYGATGGRVDHLLGNLGLLLHYRKQGKTVRIKDPFQEIWLVDGRVPIIGTPGQELSLISVTESATIRTEGLRYPLNRESLRMDSPRGISNVFLAEDAVIEVSSGIVLVALLSRVRG